jgi:hypothetical protein
MKRKSLYDQSDCLEWEFKVIEFKILYMSLKCILLFFIYPFNVDFLLVYLYLGVNLSNESDFCLAFCLPNKNVKKYY